jgi:hypothetical protein
MKKFAALGYLLGFPVAFAGVIPQIVTILLFSNAPALAGVFNSFGILGLGITGTLFSYFVSGFFPTGGGISNFIMGL